MKRGNFYDKERGLKERLENKRTIEIDISEEEIMHIMRSIPQPEGFDSDYFEEAQMLMKLSQRLLDAWEKTGEKPLEYSEFGNINLAD